MVDIVVPPLSESVVEATVAEWQVKVGDTVSVGDVLVLLETDKVALEVAAEESGVISEIVAQEDEDVAAGQLLARLDSSGVGVATSAAKAESKQAEAPPVVASQALVVSDDSIKATPVAQRMAKEHGIDLNSVPSSNGGKIDKADVQAFIERQSQKITPAPAKAKPVQSTQRNLEAREERIKMSRRRRTIARHLIEAQSTAAMLTTFNEVDMTAIMELRSRRKEVFREKYGVGLGINSFFIKAVVGALKQFPMLNAEIEGDYIIKKDYYDIGVAVGSDEGLVVPVLRGADSMSFVEIEKGIKNYAMQVRDNSLPLEALRGGTFTVTNGGVFGSMLSTPILNYPQVAILGLHGIKDRVVVVDGEVAIRPWMYIALTYDHRIVDGSDAVRFLVTVKNLVEDPETLLIEG
ncbi:MAG: 2-oxoglutarate dehydrogenase complex dihydrolipoyllysine-residue succinyltransferase [Anaerolineae bacterium]|nr:2-oxoglutarate dehydrogenase complex dihydrolipoyllysine-residue succinyltransferase [Anaerolineae bacterium]